MIFAAINDSPSEFFTTVSMILQIQRGERADSITKEALIFSERELTFTFAICCRPSVCLSVVCSVLLRRFKFSEIFLRH